MSAQRSRIKEIFLKNGFTIKASHDDLKEYVYAAAEELLNSELAALKEENERLKARVAELDQSNNILHRRVAKLVEIIQECGCDDDI